MTERDDTTPADGAALPTWLRDILRCPACGGHLVDARSDAGPELVCQAPDCGLAYRVEDSVPVLLVDEARPTR